MKIFRDVEKLRKWSLAQVKKGSRIALVPTMGYLHDGHMSLIDKAKKLKADEIVVSIFVNPVQFGPNEDYAKYPRDEKRDLKKCREHGATAVFLPTPEIMYSGDHSVYVNEEELSNGLCGARRPGHFRGVCTVLAKLFNIVRPEFAVFGQKDYQQAQIVRRMVRDLNFGIDIIVAPIVREKSGLALSSRNKYLSAEEKCNALAISKALGAVELGNSAAKERARIARALEKAALVVDYVEFVDSETLKPVKKTAAGVCILIAAFCGKTRLIDNRVL